MKPKGKKNGSSQPAVPEKTEIFHALVLNLHQPAGNLEQLIEDPHKEWEAREILWSLDRMPRVLWGYEDVARVHLSLSGTLLQTLSDPAFQSRVYGTVDCGSLLWYLQNRKIFEILGTGYYHPVLPLIPAADWDEQLGRWRGMGSRILGREDFPGFWPPEMGFCMELIPHLRRAGYRYVLVDSQHVQPVSEMSWQELRYRPHLARYKGEEIIVVVRDRELSDAQESGMDYGWFYHELNERTKWCDFPPLVTTCTDGDNGGWFRNTSGKGNFWGAFYSEFMDAVRSGKSTARPMFINDYLDCYGAQGEVTVNAGAWNTGWHHGVGFVQWTGSETQKEGLERVRATSEAVHRARRKAQVLDHWHPDLARELEEAEWHLLRAQTSCNFFWGEAWVGRALEDLNEASAHVTRAYQLMP